MWRHTLFLFMGISLLCGIPKEALGEGDDDGVETIVEGAPTQTPETEANAQKLSQSTSNTANSAGGDLGKLASSPTSLLDPGVPQQINSVVDETKKAEKELFETAQKKGIRTEDLLKILALSKSAFMSSLNNAASQSKRPSMQVEQSTPAQVIRSGGFEAPASPEGPVRWGGGRA